ncbi:MAG TPA: hypothetical protein VHB48_08835 [Chitinophagaceae bacterium]|nr:hypothetical protein [Chitinophagaceae bacterium]
MLQDINALLIVIEKKLDWGDSSTWQTKDFEEISERILEETGVSLSLSTLRRVWGRVEYNHLPSTTTMDTLAKFAGYESWRAFNKQPTPLTGHTGNAETGEDLMQHTTTPLLPVQPAVKSKARKYWVAAAIVLFVVAGSVIGARAFRRGQPPVDLSVYKFSSKRLTHSLPNSVVFSYDASAAPEDSIFIQQSWDPSTKTLVDKNLHEHTSVYYEPGYYDAKLMVGQKVVKQHRLLIPTDGWLGIIENKPVPVYIKQGDYLHKDSLSFPVSGIVKNNIPLQPQPPVIKYFNLGNFDSVPVNNFSFTAQVKNEYSDGSAACQLTAIFLITDADPIIIPLSVKGCASELNLMSVDQKVSGKKADLSGFGVDFSQWANIACKSTRTTIKYFVNGRLAFECPLPVKSAHIVGFQFAFQGTGAVKGINLSTGGKTVFSAF